MGDIRECDKEELVSAQDNVATPEHCYHAFDALYCALKRVAPIEPKFPDEDYPLFVTWYTRSNHHNASQCLRGCIGTFEPQPIREGLAKYALISAFNDSRFRPIEERELSSLECGQVVSLLTNFEDAENYLDWSVGIHGIHITFPHPSVSGVLADSSGTPSPSSSSTSIFGRYSRSTARRTLNACYLPDVIPEQGWNKTEAIDSAIHKAGWTGRITEELRRTIKLRRYQSSKCEVTWKEYIAWRKANAPEN